MQEFFGFKKYLMDLKGLNRKKVDIFKIFVLDIGFFVSILVLALIFNSIVKYLDNTVLLQITVLIYFLLIILLYSIFKLLILNQIKEISFKKFKRFCFLNIFNFILLFLIWFTINSIITTINERYQPIILTILIGIFCVFSFVYVNVSQSRFIKLNNVINSIKRGMNGSFEFKDHREVWWGIVLSIIFGGAFIIIGFGLGFTNIDPYNLTGFNKIIGPLFGIGIIVTFYILFTLTRYLIIKRCSE